MPEHLSPALLCRLLRYDPETGKLFWRARALSMFSLERAGRTWNTCYAGKEAFITDDTQGYKVGSIFGRLYKAHRVIWAMQTGEWPESHIDHRDLDPANNRWHNLREATRSQNLCNTNKRSNNTSGYKGVSWSKRSRKWKATITHQNKQHRLGYFSTPEEAHAAYRAAAEKHHGEFRKC